MTEALLQIRNASKTFRTGRRTVTAARSHPSVLTHSVANELTFKDPHKRHTVVLKTLAASKLEVIEHQRKARPAHVENLAASIDRIGFIVPLVAVEAERDGKSRYLVIDGQHRLEAAREEAQRIAGLRGGS